MERKIGKPLLEMENVEIGFLVRGRYRRVVNNLNLVVHEGETLGLVGESGSGKTTIGRAIIRVNKIHAGTIKFQGKNIDGKLSKKQLEFVHKNIQMIFQDPAASLNERATVDYIIAEGIDNYKEYKDNADRQDKILQVIKSVGLLPEHLTRYPHEFSGGQRQRIGVARALIMQPKLVIADEPISALDVSIRAQVLNLLRRIQLETGLSLLFIAHDLSVVRYISDRIAVISQGDIVEVAEAEELFKNPLHPYTKSLLNAIPQPDPLSERDKKLVTYDPSQHDYSINKPKLEEVSPGHFVFGNEDEIKGYVKQIKK